MKKVLVTAVLAASTALPSPISTANAQTTSSISSTTNYHTVTVDGLKIFYREAGPKDAPTILLLHGYPSSSRMFATLIPLLADRYHLVAPDYPGFGESDAPPAATTTKPLARRCASLRPIPTTRSTWSTFSPSVALRSGRATAKSPSLWRSAGGQTTAGTRKM